MPLKLKLFYIIIYRLCKINVDASPESILIC